MGFPENKKLAKDINKNTGECTEKLEALLSSLNSQMALMNSLISSISGGYVSKDYVDEKFGQSVRIERKSYRGTGLSGADYPCSLTFDSEPEIIFYTGYKNVNIASTWQNTDYSDTNFINVVDCRLITEDYSTHSAFGDTGNRGKKVGKTIYWYGSNAGNQLNVDGHEYYFLAFVRE